MGRQVHLVGSVLLDDAEAVFRALSERLGSRAPRYPDGETGERHYWITWQSRVFEVHPSFEQVAEPVRPGAPWKPFRLVEGIDADGLEFGPLGYAAAAIESHQVFRRLRDGGVIPSGTRFMVALPTPIAVVNLYVVEPQRQAILPAYTAAMARELAEILARIPGDDLAVQWDVMHEIVAHAGGPIVLPYPDIVEGTLERLRQLCEPIPDEVELGFHLCYGDPGHKHLVEPTDLGTSVLFANEISKAVDHRVDWIHMAVPRDRFDDAYFEPLERLEIPKNTMLVLGLVHYTDGVDGTWRRLATAERHRADFAIATECGFGRREPSTMLELLNIHAAVADG